MRFTYLKHGQVCFHCKGIVKPGEEAVIITTKNGRPFPLVFHTGCFTDWSQSTYIRRLLSWRESATRPARKARIKKKMGRPYKYTNSTQSRRIKALLFYHIKMGHEERVKTLQQQLFDITKAKP